MIILHISLLPLKPFSSESTQILKNMLYIFEVIGSDFIKFGYTRNQNVYYRIQSGFWTNIHPEELCGKLAPENLKLHSVFVGDMCLESRIKSTIKPSCGEFYKREFLNILTNILKFLTTEGPIFHRPTDNFFVMNFEKLPCCSGISFSCNICGKNFKREHKLYEHKREVHAKKNRITCGCGEIVIKRNLKRHELTKKHQGYINK